MKVNTIRALIATALLLVGLTKASAKVETNLISHSSHGSAQGTVADACVPCLWTEG